MKKFTWVLIIISLLVFVGCTPESKAIEGYIDISVDEFTLSIPNNWVKEDITDDPDYAQILRESEGAVDMIVYTDKSDSAYLFALFMNMSDLMELEGDTWEGWEQFEETEGFSKQEFSLIFSTLVLGEAEKVTREETHMLTIDKKEAYELIYSAEMGGISTNVNTLSIFGDNTTGMIIFIVKKVAWPTFQNSWSIIRDSAKLR